ncbi:uncharacterized protein LOC129576345 [Sitodiplosis mosellana]|uniref:uncharacterized protein LOC129576345 n=1 Tax=Sitodiplosis mosellana TaxID=263140 RepID=UPI002443A955|nr:uncharacterized protein LOC129576345 [Sitodiplosis mosellana]
MTKKLDSVRRSLFREFDDDDDDSLEKLGNNTKKTSRATIKLNNTFIAAALVLTVVIAALSNKVIQTLLKDMNSELSSKVNAGVEWTQVNYVYLTQPLVVAVLVTIFMMTINYFDSDVPGICPPTPFTPRKAQQIRYSTHKEKTNHLSFLVSIGSGIVTFFLLYL